jgi:hypothetical protein
MGADTDRVNWLTRDLPTIAFSRAGPLLRRSGPVPGILAAHRPGGRLWMSLDAGLCFSVKGKSHKHFQLQLNIKNNPLPPAPLQPGYALICGRSEIQFFQEENTSTS